MSRRKLVVAAVSLVVVLAGSVAHAFVIQLGGPTGYRARIEVTQVASNQLRILVTNLTTFGLSVPLPTGVSGSCPQLVQATLDAACRLLASFGWTQNAITQSITGGSAKIAAGSEGYGNPDGPPPAQTYPAGTYWSAEWGYGNNEPMDGTGLLDFISTNESHMTPFASGPNRDKGDKLDGPQGGLLSQAFTDAGGLGFVKDTLEFLVTFSAGLTPADLTSLQKATWWVEFGSSGYFLCAGPDPRCPRVAASEPGSVALMGTALVGVLAAGGLVRRRRKAPRVGLV